MTQEEKNYQLALFFCGARIKVHVKDKNDIFSNGLILQVSKTEYDNKYIIIKDDIRGSTLINISDIKGEIIEWRSPDG